MNLASRLKQARKFRGYTQDALANALGVSRGVITNIEYEKVEPQKLVIHAICKELKINENWLMFGQGSMENNINLEKSALLLSEIYNYAKKLSEDEQDYILDIIKAFQKYRKKASENKLNELTNIKLVSRGGEMTAQLEKFQMQEALQKDIAADDSNDTDLF